MTNSSHMYAIMLKGMQIFHKQSPTCCTTLVDHKICAHVVPQTAHQLRGENVHHAIGSMAARTSCGHRAKCVHCRIGHMGDKTLHSQSQQQEMVYISSRGCPTGCKSLINIKLRPMHVAQTQVKTLTVHMCTNMKTCVVNVQEGIDKNVATLHTIC